MANSANTADELMTVAKNAQGPTLEQGQEKLPIAEVGKLVKTYVENHVNFTDSPRNKLLSATMKRKLDQEEHPTTGKVIKTKDTMFPIEIAVISEQIQLSSPIGINATAEEDVEEPMDISEENGVEQDHEVNPLVYVQHADEFEETDTEDEIDYSDYVFPTSKEKIEPILLKYKDMDVPEGKVRFIVYHFDFQIVYHMVKDYKMEKLKRHVAGHLRRVLGITREFSFKVNGNFVEDEDTPISLEMENDDIMVLFPKSGESCQVNSSPMKEETNDNEDDENCIADTI